MEPLTADNARSYPAHVPLFTLELHLGRSTLNALMEAPGFWEDRIEHVFGPEAANAVTIDPAPEDAGLHFEEARVKFFSLLTLARAPWDITLRNDAGEEFHILHTTLGLALFLEPNPADHNRTFLYTARLEKELLPFDAKFELTITLPQASVGVSHVVQGPETPEELPSQLEAAAAGTTDALPKFRGKMHVDRDEDTWFPDEIHFLTELQEPFSAGTLYQLDPNGMHLTASHFNQWICTLAVATTGPRPRTLHIGRGPHEGLGYASVREAMWAFDALHLDPAPPEIK